MKRLVIGLGLVVVAMILLLVLTRPAGLPGSAIPGHSVDVSNGERLFHAGGCASCHRSPDDHSDPAVLAGGLEMETPFGVFRVPNISPHSEQGIGGWTMIEFVNAMWLGVSPDGLHYYPAFPYASYSRMRIEDLMDLKSYLDTLPVSEDESADHTLRFPYNIRSGLGLWKLANLDAAFVTEVAVGDKQWVKGQYLVEGPGHCGECHTPRNWTGGLDNGRWLAGAPNPEGEGKVPDIRPLEGGLDDWSQSDIEYYLESGFTPDFDSVGASMVKVQENMARLPAGDRAAIAYYLKNLPKQ